MNKSERSYIKEKAMVVVRLLQDEISINPRSVGRSTITYKLKSDLFYDKIKRVFGNLDEITWVKVLKYLRETPKYNEYYEGLMKVPFEHDGGSSMYFPEVYDGAGKILVKTKVDIKNISVFYPEIPGIEDRSWKKGEIVYVPQEKASRFIKINWMEQIA